MAAARPLVNVYDGRTGQAAGTVPLPNVFTAPIRRDIVQFVHAQMAKNKRQAHGVAREAGHQHSAESWGTGRAVSRIPRVSGSGTHANGAGAFGNMCRGGRMFAPIKTWRKWHRKINVNQRRYATVSALAASAVPALVMARGHKIENVNEVPLVLNNVEDMKKTKDAVATLERFGAYDDVQRVKDSKQIRAGVGKARNRRYVMGKGPLVIYSEGNGIELAFRNLPGVELCHVDRLNLLQLTPGGHMGRFIIWTEGAFKRLDALWGSDNEKSQAKFDYSLPRPTLTNADLARIINSEEVQKACRPTVKATKYVSHKKNPLRNLGAMVKLNPHAMTVKRMELLNEERAAQGKAVRVAGKRKTLTAEKKRQLRAESRAFANALVEDEYTFGKYEGEVEE